MRVRTEKPDCSGLYDQDWLQSVHRNIRETLPEKCPMPRGKIICMMTHKDAFVS